MKELRLIEGHSIWHDELGYCIIKHVVPDFGPALMPDTEKGKKDLKEWSGKISPMLETNFDLMKFIIEL